MPPKEEFEKSVQSIDQALGEIERTLEQMLTLAQLSASDLNVDREALQKTLERLQRKIDRIADTIWRHFSLFFAKSCTFVIAPEQKARVTYDNILRLSDDPDVSDVIKFLRAREIVHFQRFGETNQSE